MAPQQNKRILYVGGLTEEVTEEILHAAFIPFGELVEVNIPKDHASKTSDGNRGFAFVEFELEPDADEAASGIVPSTDDRESEEAGQSRGAGNHRGGGLEVDDGARAVDADEHGAHSADRSSASSDSSSGFNCCPDDALLGLFNSVEEK